MKTALDMKEMLLARLKRMNDEVDAGMHKEENGQRPAAFQKAYAQILLDLQNVRVNHCPYCVCMRAADPARPSASTPFALFACADEQAAG